MTTPQLPNPTVFPTDDKGWRPVWYNYLKWLGERDTSTEAAELPDYKLVGPLSVVVSGLLQNGLASLALTNDQLSPAALSYYGTDEDGAKGWHALTAEAVAYDNTDSGLAAENVQAAIDEIATGAGVPYFIASGQSFQVPLYKQALFSMPIDVEGTLTVDGYLIEVS